MKYIILLIIVIAVLYVHYRGGCAIVSGGSSPTIPHLPRR